ncbi:MAG: hypothetical protein LUH10_06445 [Tannerellaceae bacterium]|nr:hypothetical protein [Tannerellaceae bacterium]
MKKNIIKTLFCLLLVQAGFSVYASEPVTLYDKTLPELQKLLNGKWILLSGQNETVYFEFDDTTIEFKNTMYIWKDEEGEEGDNLNWRREPTDNGYDAWVSDVFYEDNPSYPLMIRNDTLLIQDITEEQYLYKLVRQQ